MSTQSPFSKSRGSTSDISKDSFTSKRDDKCGCDIDIHIDSHGDVNIYNCAPPSKFSQTPPSTCQSCFPPYGSCIPAVAGAKHKLSREQKLDQLAEDIPVPSSLAAGTMHMIRRFLLGKTPANPLETNVFTTLGKISRDILSCIVAAFDATPLRQRNRLFAPSLLLDPDQPVDDATFTTALAQEIKQRVGVQVFGDPNGTDQERPGRMRVYEPQGEDFFSQVRICTVNGLRTANFIPPINIDGYDPAEMQRDCKIIIVDGEPQPDCQTRTTDCPGNMLRGVVCARVPDVALGDGVVLEGVNYFSLDAKVRFTDKQTGTPVRDVDTHVWGDIQTPLKDPAGQLINDCRVHDKLTFQVPDDLAPGIYAIQVVVPNITGISALGIEIVSTTEYINVIPPATARFEISTETIIARQETSPEWLGSDEVGLHTLAAALNYNDQDKNFELVDLPCLKPDQTCDRDYKQTRFFKAIQNVDFDSGTRSDITEKVFAPDKPILGMLLVVYGDEIDSQGFYAKDITSQTEYFLEILGAELGVIGSAFKALGGDLGDLRKLSALDWWLIAAAGAVMIGIDIIIAWWAPADPIIRDSIGLSINELATLTSFNAPSPAPTTFKTGDGIVVNVNKTIPPVKIPLEYHETREYESNDSAYEITYRYSHVV